MANKNFYVIVRVCDETGPDGAYEIVGLESGTTQFQPRGRICHEALTSTGGTDDEALQELVLAQEEEVTSGWISSWIQWAG